MEFAGARRLRKPAEDMHTVFRVNDLRAGGRIAFQRLARPPSNGLVSRADVKEPQVLCVQHPEDLLNVAGHLAKTLLALTKSRFRALSFGNVAQNDQVPAGKIAGVRSVLDEYWRIRLAKNARFPMLLLKNALREIRFFKKLPGGPPYDFLPAGFEKRESRRVGLKTEPAVVENEDCIERAVEDGLVLRFCVAESVHRFAV